MISSEVINAMIDLIDENIRLIEEIRSQGYESFSNNFRDIQAAKHALQESIEACLDMGNHIISEISTAKLIQNEFLLSCRKT